MALTELLRTLEDEGRTRIEEILAAARAEAERLRRAGDAARTADRAAAVRVREQELRAEAARALEAARRGATAQVLEARAEALDRVRARAGARLAARSADPALLPLLHQELVEGLGYLGEGPAVVEADAALVDAVRSTLNGRPGVTLAAGGHGGLLIRSADGRMAVDASFGARLAGQWPSLAIELARRMEAMR